MIEKFIMYASAFILMVFFVLFCGYVYDRSQSQDELAQTLLKHQLRSK